MEKNPGHWKDLIQLVLENNEKYSWRAAWLLGNCIQKNDIRMQKYVGELVRILPERKDSEQRELLRILSIMRIGEELEGALFDACMSIWEQIHKQSGLRFLALKQMAAMTKRYPELGEEMRHFSEPRYTETLSPAIQTMAIKLVHAITK